jgi:hypothetical protein
LTELNVCQLQGLPGGSPHALKLVSAAFPALHRLVLESMSMSCADLSSLSACSHLMHLEFHWCQLQHAEAASNRPSPLSALHSLRHLTAHYTTSSIAAGLTQLAGLSLACRHQQAAECLGHITACTQLQHLELDIGDDIIVEEIVSILTSLKQLTSLLLECLVTQPEFDALLTHGTQLSSVTCSYLSLVQDRSASACSWKELVMLYQGLDAETLACIPTASLTRLAFERSAVFPSPSPTLEFAAWHMADPGNMPGVVGRSLLNLMRCPAWQQCGPSVNVKLWGDIDDPTQLNRLLGALAPLAGKEVKLAIERSEALGTSVVQQLVDKLGSSLKQLVLAECQMTPDIWPAIGAQLPGLQQLTIGDKVHGAIGAHELAVFCSCATRPLQLSLGQRLYKQVVAEGMLDQQGRWAGVPHVTVTEAKDV